MEKIIDIEKLELNKDKSYILKMGWPGMSRSEWIPFAKNIQQALKEVGFTNVLILPIDISLEVIEE